MNGRYRSEQPIQPACPPQQTPVRRIRKPVWTENCSVERCLRREEVLFVKELGEQIEINMEIANIKLNKE